MPETPPGNTISAILGGMSHTSKSTSPSREDDELDSPLLDDRFLMMAGGGGTFADTDTTLLRTDRDFELQEASWTSTHEHTHTHTHTHTG